MGKPRIVSQASTSLPHRVVAETDLVGRLLGRPDDDFAERIRDLDALEQAIYAGAVGASARERLLLDTLRFDARAPVWTRPRELGPERTDWSGVDGWYGEGASNPRPWGTLQGGRLNYDGGNVATMAIPGRAPRDDSDRIRARDLLNQRRERAADDAAIVERDEREAAAREDEARAREERATEWRARMSEVAAEIERRARASPSADEIAPDPEADAISDEDMADSWEDRGRDIEMMRVRDEAERSRRELDDIITRGGGRCRDHMPADPDAGPLDYTGYSAWIASRVSATYWNPPKRDPSGPGGRPTPVGSGAVGPRFSMPGLADEPARMIGSQLYGGRWTSGPGGRPKPE